MNRTNPHRIDVAFSLEGASTSTVWTGIEPANDAFSDGRVSHDVPQMIPKDELLLWSPQWRALVAEARDEIARGEAVDFTNFRDMASWLLSADDD